MSRRRDRPSRGAISPGPLPAPRHVIAPGSRPGSFDVYWEDPDRLTYLGSERSLEQALRLVGVCLVDQLWDAPIIDPAEPSTHPGHDGDPRDLFPDFNY